MLGSVVLSFGQEQWCATDQNLEEYFEQHPEKRQAFMQEQLNLANATPIKGSQNSKAPIHTIPVVVHVMHLNGDGNISDQQVHDAIRILNDDFQKLNPDTVTVRAIFKPYIADSQIEFKLAQLDPNGNCTEGINRVNTPLTNSASNAIKSLAYWDANKYLNIWVVNDIASSGAGSILGFAQFPSNFGNLSTYGIVIRNDEMGSIETAIATDGRTLTHEVGHCFGLFHTFQSACGSFCNSTGDLVCDTPPQFDDNSNSCNFAFNTCANDATGGTSTNPNPYTANVPDQLENYMGYGLACLGMFTEGQKSRMLSAIASTNNLVNLRSASNLIATGTSPNFSGQPCVPTAEIFDRQQKLVCINGSITFSDNSHGGPVTTYDWEFPGGTPSTSSSATPTITYNSVGVHDVILRVSNSSGADTLIISDLVRVNDSIGLFGGFNYNEGFENSATASQFTSIPSNDNISFLRTGAVGLSSSFSFFINNFSTATPGERDFLISPTIDLTQVAAPTFQFDVAFQTQINSSDQLRCAISTDCGLTWITRAIIPASSLSSGASSGSSFVPSSSSDWKTFTVTTTNAIRSSTNAMFRFEFISGGGNNLFIDNLRINGLAVGLEAVEENPITLNLYPNPTINDQTTLEFALSAATDNGFICLTDILGKTVKEVYRGALNTNDYKFSINTSDLESGIYFLSIQTEDKRKVQKLVVN